MSRRYPDPRRPYQGSPRHKSIQPEEEDDEEEVEIKLSPSGSVLMAAPNPYDKMQRIREANTQLKQTKTPTQKTGKVRFNEKVILYSEDYSSEPRMQRYSSGQSQHVRQGQNKILLVTVPTGFSEDHDDALLSDEGDEVSDETAFRWGQTRCDPEHETSAIPNEEEIIHEIVETEQADEKADVVEEVEEIEEVKDLSDEMNIKCSIDVEKDDQANPVEFKVFRERIMSAKHKKEDKNNKKIEQIKIDTRPKSAPKRLCLSEDSTQLIKLPSYNGLRSEYGLTAEQLLERKKKKAEAIRSLRKEREEKYLEEKKRQKENDQMFSTWLVRKKKEAAMKYARKRQQNSYYFKTLPAPTSHLDKMGVLRKKVLSKKEHTCYSLEEFFKHAKPHEQKTYRIYLGLCVE